MGAAGAGSGAGSRVRRTGRSLLLWNVGPGGGTRTQGREGPAVEAAKVSGLG